MVIVVTAPTKVDASSLATALADRLGWPWVDAYDHWDAGAGPRPEPSPDGLASGRSDVPRNIRHLAVEASGRREPLILTAAPLSLADYVGLSEGLRQVRVVGLAPVRRDDVGAGHTQPGQSISPVIGNPASTEDTFTHVTLDSSADIDTLVGHVRLAFGV